MAAEPGSDARKLAACGRATLGARWWTLGCVGLLGATVPLLLGILYLYFHMPTWTGAAADLMAGGMVPPDDGEVAITPYTPTASTIEYAALSGRGEGLDCSIPPIIEQNAFPGTQVSLAYRQACVAHDYCYRHGAVTYGYTQSDCDAALARATLRICRNSADNTERADCVGRARRVYAGLMAGGSSSFRPAKPDARLSEVDAAKGQKARCYSGVKVNAAFKSWGDRLAMHVLGRCDLARALAGKYDELDQRALDQVMEAWLNMASVAGEYDPYPLGGARLSVPRLAPDGSGGTSLFFYLQRAGGSEVREYHWQARKPGQIQGICDAAQCGGVKRVMPISAGWEGISSTPWVARPDGTRPGLLWWRRRFTNQNTTGGNVGRLWSVVPQDKKERSAWRFNLASAWEPNAPNPYFVTGARGDERLAAFYYDPCPRDRPRRLVLSQLRIRSGRLIEPGRTDLSDPRSIDDLGGGPLLSALAIPPLVVRDRDGVSVTIFRRDGEAGRYRKSIGAQTWRVPDAAPRPRPAANPPSLTARRQTNTDGCPNMEAFSHGHPASPTTSIYALSEEQEPFAPLPRKAGPPLLFAIRCEHPDKPGWISRLKIRFGLMAAERCAAKQTVTEVSLSAAGANSRKALAIEGRYVSRVPIFQVSSTGDYAAVFVRFALRKVAEGVRLEAFARVVAIHNQQLMKGDETRLGVVSPGDETKASAALARSSRLVPLIGDTDGDGWPDLVVADPDNGAATLSYPGGYSHGQLAFGTEPTVRR